MAVLRVNLDFAFPLPLAPIVKTRLDALKAEITKAKVYAIKINSGLPNEEMTISAKYHVCHHDEGANHPPCEKEADI